MESEYLNDLRGAHTSVEPGPAGPPFKMIFRTEMGKDNCSQLLGVVIGDKVHAIVIAHDSPPEAIVRGLRGLADWLEDFVRKQEINTGV